MNKDKYTIEYDAECSACHGTGIYVGFGELDGAGVVCHRCNGSGCQHVNIEYYPFTKKKKTTRVKRVFPFNPGIVIGNAEDGAFTIDDFGGVPYAEWFRNSQIPFTEMRRFVCPAWWYQYADYKLKPEWEECIVVGSFSNCKHFKCKQSCWERFDNENKNC